MAKYRMNGTMRIELYVTVEAGSAEEALAIIKEGGISVDPYKVKQGIETTFKTEGIDIGEFCDSYGLDWWAEYLDEMEEL